MCPEFQDFLEFQEFPEFLEFRVFLEFGCFRAELGANTLWQNIYFENVPTLKIMLACFFEKNDPFMGSPGSLTMIARTVVKFYVGWYQECLEILILDPIRFEKVFFMVFVLPRVCCFSVF